VSIKDNIAYTETLYSSSVTLVRRGIYKDSVPVVVKSTAQDVPDEGLITQYKTSCQAQQKIFHPAVNKVIEYVLDGAGCALFLEDIGGNSLSFWINKTLKKHTRWPLEIPGLFHLYLLRLLRWSVTLAEGMSELHQQGVIHNDINPANITVNPETDRLQIIDFGAAYPNGSNITDSAAVDQYRTLTYISPEQTGRLNRSVDYRSDYYAFGATLYQLFSGRPPFVAKDLPELIHCHIARHPASLNIINPLLPVSLSVLIQKLMAKAPEDRYQNGRCLIQDLKAIELAVKTGIPLSPDALGRNDVPERLLIPVKLYGRDKELAILKKALCDRHEKPALIAIEGEAGGGKTSLVNEAVLHLVDHPVLVLSGKCDTYNKRPYFAFSQALVQSVDVLLKLANRTFFEWRQSLLEELNQNPHTLIGLCSELSSIFDGVDVVEKGLLHNADIQIKLHTAIFLRHLSQLDPVLFIIDDVQWCDVPSLLLLEALVEADHPRMTYIFTCRTDEIDESHPYNQLKDAINTEGVHLSSIVLGNLELSKIVELLDSTFHHIDDDYRDIGSVLLKHTLGNPFFIREFLKAADKKNDGTLFYSREKGKWFWDIEKLQQVAISGNVVALLIDVLHQQDDETQRVLQWASCLGSKFDTELLAEVTSLSVDNVRKYLNPAYKQGYIQRVVDQSDDFVFSHDRIRQAYYELQPVENLSSRHWHIAWVCLRDSARFVNDPLPHFLESLSDKYERFLIQGEDVGVLVSAFMDGAKLAKDNMAYDMALQYVNCARKLIDECDGNNQCYENEVFVQSIESIFLLQGILGYLTKNPVFAESSFENYRNVVDDPLKKASSYAQQIPLIFALGDFDVTITYSLKCFSLLGVDVPEFGEDISPQIDEQWVRFRAFGGFYEVDRLQEHKENNSMALSTLHSIASTMMLLGLNVRRFQWAEWFGLVGINSCLIDGYTKSTPQLMGIFDSMLHTVRGVDVNNSIVSKACDLIKDGGNFPGDGFVYNSVGAYGGRYNRPMIECIEYLELGAKCSLGKGDYLPYLACTSNKIVISFSSGVSLLKLQKEVDDFKDILVSFGKFISVGKIYFRLIYQLVNEDSEDLLERDCFSDSQWGMLKKSVAYGAYFHLRLQSEFWKGHYSNVHREYVLNKDLLGTLNGFSIGDDNHFLYAISLFQSVPVDDSVSLRKALASSTRSVQYIQEISEIYPPNFRHKALLIKAELQRLKGDSDATATYELAANDARENGFIQMYALAHELHAYYWQQKGRADYVKFHVEKALQGYHRWGCGLKIGHLQRCFGSFLHQQIQSEFIDHKSILKISNEITEELDLTRRLTHIIELAVENVNAEGGILLLKDQGQYVAHTEAYFIGEEDQGRTADFGILPMEFIDDCALSKQPVLIRDAEKDPRCSSWVMSQVHKVSSLLCYPVVHKGECQSLLLLAHSEPDAFTGGNRQFLQSLAPQIAVSIENAQLYQDHQGFNLALEQKVTQRTHELRAANEELHAFTASVSHDLRAPLRAIIGFTGALAEDFSQCLSKKSRLDAKKLVDESENMREIIDGLIVLSRSTQGWLRREEVNLSTLVEDKLRWLRTMEAEHRVVDTVQQGLTTDGDLRLLKQVVDNLVTNAWKFSHGEEVPAISFGMLATSKSQHTFYVRDSGVGFDAANADELFSPFRRFHKDGAFEGSGIGLATVYRIIKRHGGEIWVESEVNQGATFYFTLNTSVT